MVKSTPNPQVDFFFNKKSNWQKEVILLRKIVLTTGLSEELKWGVPCYCLEKANVVLIHCFKEYCAILFMQGALLKDAHGILIQQTKNVQAARQIRFRDANEIVEQESIIKAYIQEAIELQKAGIKVQLKEVTQFDVPEEFQLLLNKSASFKKAFYQLSPGRQRGYLLYFAAAKQPATRLARIEKYKAFILKGKGLKDV